MHVVVSQLTTSPQALQFFEPNYIYLLTNFLDNLQRKLMHPKSCSVGGGRRKASGIFETCSNTCQHNQKTCFVVSNLVGNYLGASTQVVEFQKSSFPRIQNHQVLWLEWSEILWNNWEKHRKTALYIHCLCNVYKAKSELITPLFAGTRFDMRGSMPVHTGIRMALDYAGQLLGHHLHLLVISRAKCHKIRKSI